MALQKNGLLFFFNRRKNINNKPAAESRSLQNLFLPLLFKKFSQGVNPTDEFA
ncbi:MAG: hypothetical protein LH614_01365 [Pyrinomonadaceae bacterium]|nr:hypothetical protein [Pyrinomonadaceae bacterium]